VSFARIRQNSTNRLARSCPTANCILHIVHCTLPCCTPQTAKCTAQTAHCRLQTAHCKLLSLVLSAWIGQTGWSILPFTHLTPRNAHACWVPGSAPNERLASETCAVQAKESGQPEIGGGPLWLAIGHTDCPHFACLSQDYILDSLACVIASPWRMLLKVL